MDAEKTVEATEEAEKLAHEMDKMLQDYLNLLDQYTMLRSQLNSLQSMLYLDLAGANFSSDRGLRFGQDWYDDRMCASRLISISYPDPDPSSSAPILSSSIPSFSSPTTEESLITNATNPLNMFGLLHPPLLRSAQRNAVAMVESLIPRLASTDAQMRELEIGIRRGRKRGRKMGMGTGHLVEVKI